MLTDEQSKAVLSESEYRTSRSGGKGGQNVNKVESQVEIAFDVAASTALDEAQKSLILAKLPLPVIRVKSNAQRSQAQNRRAAEENLIARVNALLQVRKKRKPTRPGKAAREKKLKDKKMLSEKKANRRSSG